jgi:hypothetical protein
MVQLKMRLPIKRGDLSDNTCVTVGPRNTCNDSLWKEWQINIPFSYPLCEVHKVVQRQKRPTCIRNHTAAIACMGGTPDCQL